MTKKILCSLLMLVKLFALYGANDDKQTQFSSKFREEEVIFQNKKDSVTLSGTLSYPARGTRFRVVILISGSGPSDRNESYNNIKPFKTIAEYLSSNGFAVLRYDDRGCGKSNGKNYPQHTSADLAGDVEAAIAFLKENQHVLPGEIGLLGHSEGGMIAAMVAARSKDVAFVISFAGPACKITEVMKEQNRLLYQVGGMPVSWTDHYLNFFYAPVMNTIITQKEIPAVRLGLYQNFTDYRNAVPDSEYKAFVVIKDTLYTELFIAQLCSPWFKYFLAYDPSKDWERVTQPVLALNGTKDIQVVASQNLPCLEECLKKAGNNSYKIVKAEGYNHIFQKAKTGAVAEYFTLKGDVAPEIMEIIVTWLNDLPVK